MAFKRIDVSGPESTERRQPGIHFLKWFRFQPVDTPLCVDGRFHEAGLAQHAQVLRHGRLSHIELPLDVSHRLFRRDQEAQYRAPVRLGDDVEPRFHALDIRRTAYACQGIYTSDEPASKPNCCVPIARRGELPFWWSVRT